VTYDFSVMVPVNGTTYDRGGMTLEALREKIENDATFFKIMRDEAPLRHRDNLRVHRHRRAGLGPRSR